MGEPAALVSCLTRTRGVDLLSDLPWGLRPGERFGAFVPGFEVLADRPLQVGHAVEAASRITCVVTSANQRSTKFSHHALVGVKLRDLTYRSVVSS